MAYFQQTLGLLCLFEGCHPDTGHHEATKDITSTDGYAITHAAARPDLAAMHSEL